MNALSLLHHPSPLTAAASCSRAKPAKWGPLLRVIDAKAVSNRRKAEREVARFMPGHGRAAADRSAL